MAYVSASMIAVVGISVLTGLTFSPTAQSRQIAVVIPPWQHDGFAQLTALPVAIVDFHWGRRVVILDIASHASLLGLLREKGFWMLDATGSYLCGNARKGEAI